MQAAAYLRQATQSLHHQTESVARGQEIRDHRLSMDQYRDLIAKNYFLHHILEPIIQDGLIRYDLSAFNAFFHRRLKALEADMALLQLPNRSYHLRPPELKSAAQILGGLYVVLGSKLGGRIIYKSLQATPPLQSISEFHFFASSGDAPAREWPQFCKLLDQYLQSESELEDAGMGAETVFRFFRDIYSH